MNAPWAIRTMALDYYTNNCVDSRMCIEHVDSTESLDLYLRSNRFGSGARASIDRLFNAVSNKDQYITLDILDKYFFVYHPNGDLKGLQIHCRKLDSIIYQICGESTILHLLDRGEIRLDDVFLSKPPQDYDSKFIEHILERYGSQLVWGNYYMSIV